MMEKFSLVAVKRWWIPEWLFTACVGWYRLFDLDVADWPWIKTFLTTEAFHYHGDALIYGKAQNCRICKAKETAMPQPITMFAVQSSTILSIGYDAEAQELHVVFTGGHEYVYPGFPSDLWKQFREAPSIGKFFASRIKKAYHGEKQ